MPFELALPESGKASRNIAWISLSGVTNLRGRTLLLYIRPMALKPVASWFFYKAKVNILIGTGDDEGCLRVVSGGDIGGSWEVTKSGGTQQAEDQRPFRLPLPFLENLVKRKIQDVACQIEVTETYIDVTLPKLIYAPSLIPTTSTPRQPYVMGSR